VNSIGSRFSSSLDAGIVTISEFDRAFIYQTQTNLDRMNKAWRRYFPVNNGKWDEEALKIMAEEFRQPTQFDITGVKVDTLAGSLIADLPDPTWIPVMGQKSLLTEAIAESWHRDRELCNYDDALLKVFRDGLVQSGDIQICESYDNHTPNISFKRRLPGRIIWDPYWETDDDRDAMVAYIYDYMTPDKIINTYSFASDEIRAELERYRRDKSDYPMDDSQKKNPFHRSKIGDEFQVVEKHYVEHIKTTRLIGRPYDSEEFIPFPINKTKQYLKDFGDYNDIDWETVYEDTYSDKIHKVTTIVRELAKAEIQIEKKSKIQTNGLPFYHFTTLRHAGQDMGIPEAMAGVEDTINKRESLVTELISKANGGSTLSNEKLWAGDKRKHSEWMKKKNKPGHDEMVDLDAVKTPFINMAQNQFPSAVVDQITRMYDKVMPIVSRVSNALSSVSEGSDSGILFERKFQTNMIANTLMNRGMRQFINNLAEGYFYQWQITYDGYEQDLSFRDGRKLTLNKEVSGQVYNSVKSVPRCKVEIAENKKSMTYQMRWRSVWAEMLQSIDPNISMSHYMLALNNFFKTIDMNDEDRKQAELIGEMMMVQARLDTISKVTALQTQTQSSTLQSAQIEAQLNMMMSQIAAQQQPAPVSHEAQPMRTINYPQGNSQPVNQSPIEAASGGAQIPPAQTGAFQ
jgi:hypothetical protein